MGHGKRDSDAVEEVEGKLGNKAITSRKKMKKEKKQVEGMKDGGEIPSADSIKPMERLKKRKALDKARHWAASESFESKPKTTAATETSPPSPASVLPEFHIGVFKDLASANASVRETAAENLVIELCNAQKAYENLEKKEVVDGGLQLEAEKDDGLNNCVPSLRYAIRRLIRGVSSSRECARQGFALGFSILVARISSVKVESLLKLIVNLLEVTSSTKGQEARDCLLGRLFAYGALARSRRLTEEWILDNNTPYIKELVGLLISLAAKKRYLQEPAVAIILELVEQLPAKALLNHIVEAAGLQEWFEGATEAGNPDALLLALRLREKIPIDMKFGNLLPCPFTLSKFFASDHLSCLVDCVKESTFCQPRIHSVWHVLVNTLLPDAILQSEDATLRLNFMRKNKKCRNSSSSEEDNVKNFQNFCEVVIDGSLLLSSHDRKHLAFDVILLLLSRMPVSFLPIVLSYKLVQCLMDILSTKDSWLFKVAQYFLEGLSDWVKCDDARRVAVVVAIQKHSNGKFDCITHTKTVKDLMSGFRTESGGMLLIQNLMNLFIDEGHALEEPSDQSQTTDDNSEVGSGEDKDSVGLSGNLDFLRSWVVESLPHVLKYSKLDPEPKFRVQKEILKFLAVQGLFSASLGSEVTSIELEEKFKWPKTAISSALCRMCVDQLQSLLANAQKVDGALIPANNLEADDLGSYLMKYLRILRSIPSVSFFRPLNGEDEEALEKLQAMETRLCTEERNYGLGIEANKLHALRYLLIQMLLQVLLRPGEFSETALELIICCKKAFSVPDLVDSSGEDELDGDEAPALMDVLVDTLLSLLPQSSAPTRSAIEQVFRYFCNDVTDDGLLRMLRVIKRDLKPARHKDVESEDDNEDEDFLNIVEAEESDEAETGETVESDEHTDDSEAVLETEGAEKGLPEDSNDSDEGMDDEAMFRMDSYLARIFKQKKNQSGSETAQSQLVLFKLRVLSLLEIYLHENSGKPQILTVYSNLAQAFVNPHTAEASEQLEQRIWGILQKKIFKAKDCPRGEAVQLSNLESLLEKNLKLASKPFKKKKSANTPSKKKQSASWVRHKMIVSLAQNSIYWILKTIDAGNFQEPALQRVNDILRCVLSSYFDSKKCQLKSDFLKEIFRRRPWIGHQLFGFLLEKCGCSTLEFRRIEALDLVAEMLKLQVPLNVSESGNDESRKIAKRLIPKLRHLVEKLVTNMPKKPSRRVEVRKFCGWIFQIVSKLNLNKAFLEKLAPDAEAACTSQLGDAFLTLKKLEE